MEISKAAYRNDAHATATAGKPKFSLIHQKLKAFIKEEPQTY